MCLAAGESAALTAAITTVQEAVQTMASQAEEILASYSRPADFGV
jgi:hypothetical protein